MGEIIAYSPSVTHHGTISVQERTEDLVHRLPAVRSTEVDAGRTKIASRGIAGTFASIMAGDNVHSSMMIYPCVPTVYDSLQVRRLWTAAVVLRRWLLEGAWRGFSLREHLTDMDDKIVLRAVETSEDCRALGAPGLPGNAPKPWRQWTCSHRPRGGYTRSKTSSRDS